MVIVSSPDCLAYSIFIEMSNTKRHPNKAKHPHMQNELELLWRPAARFYSARGSFRFVGVPFTTMSLYY